MLRPIVQLLLLRTKRLRREGLSEPLRRHPKVPSRVHRGRSRQLLRCVHCGLLQMQGLLLGHLVRRETVLPEENRVLLLHRLGLRRVAMLRRG